jgi:hypothetical protein
VGVWTGEEVLVVGGDTFLCPPAADCSPQDPPFSDGAAFDPATGTWRPIAAAPVAFSWASTAVIDDTVHLWVPGWEAQPGAPMALLAYSVERDAWSELDHPFDADPWRELVAVDGRLVALATSDERSPAVDWVLDPASGGWSEVPDDPLTPAYDRTAVAVGDDLLLFDKALVASPGSEGPSLTRAARLDLNGLTWERLPEGDSLAHGGWFGFDLGTGAWTDRPPVPGDDDSTVRTVVAAGRDAFVFGGERWTDGRHGQLLGDAWLWRAG